MRTQDDSKALSQPDRGQRRTPIEIPNSKFVDVAPLKGKKGQGKIGTYKVTFEFGDKSALRISGELEGEGKWDQTGAGVSMQTARSTFRGTIDGDSVSGLKFCKDNTEPLIS